MIRNLMLDGPTDHERGSDIILKLELSSSPPPQYFNFSLEQKFQNAFFCSFPSLNSAKFRKTRSEVNIQGKK
jgi:hypothetical protein